jgi:hypothetical protein
MVVHLNRNCRNLQNFTICFMDMRVLVPFGKLTLFFLLFLVVRLPLGIFAEVIAYCGSPV